MPEGIRTPDTRLRRPVLYPTELQTHMDTANTAISKRVMGIEPTYPAWKAGCSTIELHPHVVGVTGFNLRPPGPKPRSSQAEPHPEGFVCVLSVTQELVYSKEKNMSTTFLFFDNFLKLLPVSLKALSGRYFIRICCNSVPIPV